MRKRVLILLVSIAAVFGAYPAASDEPGEPHLPDLRTLTPSDFRIEVTDEGDRLLRLSNTIWNSGDGPLEVRPRHDATSGTTHALQQLFTHDEGGDFRVTGEREAGSFEFHPDHDHWHFSDFALYSLHAVLENGEMGDAIAVSDKISFCMFDQFAIDPELRHAPTEPGYTGADCYRTGGQNTPQGYSVGWGDEYAWNFVGQSIDVTNVPDDRYWLSSEADFSDLILETDDDNNGAQVMIRIEGDEVFIPTETHGHICSPCGRTRLVKGRSYEFAGSVSPSEADADLDFTFRPADGSRRRPVSEPAQAKAFTSPGGRVVSSREGQWRVPFEPHKRGRWILTIRYPRSGGYGPSSVSVAVRVVKPSP
jgi:hypothetical protein